VVLAAAFIWAWCAQPAATSAPRAAPRPSAATSAGAAPSLDAGRVPSATDSAKRPQPPERIARQSAAPDSLAGTTPDGALTVDGDGHFVINAEVRAFFDYFLTTSGELSAHDLRALIVAAIEANLPPAAAAEAVQTLDAYLGYRRAARRLAAGDGVPEDLGARLEALRRVRHETLGAELADRFFGLEEAMVAADLARREILRAEDLSSEEQRRLLWEAEQDLPEAVREARAQALLPARLHDDEEALRAAGGTDDEVQALREQTVGSAAAARLAELDREQVQWQARLATYCAERAALEADILDETTRAERLRVLREEMFTPTERLRVEAIDRSQAPH